MARLAEGAEVVFVVQPPAGQNRDDVVDMGRGVAAVFAGSMAQQVAERGFLPTLRLVEVRGDGDASGIDLLHRVIPKARCELDGVPFKLGEFKRDVPRGGNRVEWLRLVALKGERFSDPPLLLCVLALR